MPESFFESKIEFNILSEVGIVFDPVLHLCHIGAAFCQDALEQLCQGLFLCFSEDIGPHASSGFPDVGKSLNTFSSCSWKCRLGALIAEVKKSVPERWEERKGHGNT